MVPAGLRFSGLLGLLELEFYAALAQFFQFSDVISFQEVVFFLLLLLVVLLCLLVVDSVLLEVLDFGQSDVISKLRLLEELRCCLRVSPYKGLKIFNIDRHQRPSLRIAAQARGVVPFIQSIFQAHYQSFRNNINSQVVRVFATELGLRSRFKW